MSLKWTFLAFKKSCSNWGVGGGGGGGDVEVIWTKSKRTVTFFVKPSLISDADADNLIIFINAQTLDYRSASVLYLRQAAQ